MNRLNPIYKSYKPYTSYVITRIFPFHFQAVGEDDERDKIASFDSQKDESPPGAEEGEPARRVRGRNVKRRRRLRKRVRTTTEPPLEELNEQLNAAEQQNPADQQSVAEQEKPVEQEVPVEKPSLVEQTSQDSANAQPSIPEDGVTAIPPLEETTRRRPGKRRRRPHRKQSSSQQDGTPESPEDGSSETPKPPRRRRKGGRRRPRPTVQPTEPNKIELYIETTMMPPEAPEISTPSYIVESITQPPPPLTESPDHTLTVLKDDNTPLYRIYDSRHNLVSQPSVNLVVDGSSQQFPQPSRIPDSPLFPEISRAPHHSTIQHDSKMPEQTKYTETRFPQETRIPDFSEKFPNQFEESPRFPNAAKSTVILEYPEQTRFTEQQFPQPSRLPDVRQQSDISFLKTPQPSPVYEEPVEYPQISKFPDPKKYTEHQKYLEPEQNHPSELPGVVQIDTARGYSSSNIIRPKPWSGRPAANIIKPVQELIQETEPEPSEHHEERVDKETNEVPSQPPTETISRQPAFDRKALFAKSRKLPETSAVIRKKLTPRGQTDKQETGKGTSKTKLPEKMVPEGFTVPPLTVEPSKLIEKLKEHAKAYRTTTVMIPSTMITTEEPNYPKFESKKKNSVTEAIEKMTTETARFNKVVELHRSRGKAIITTTQAPQFEIPQTTDLEQTSETDTTEPGKVIVDKIPEVQTTAVPEELDLNQLNDSIVELLRSESANMKLSEILESRNMTISQLLEHRERGSKHFHLVDMFSKRKAIIAENTTDSMNADKAEVGTPVSFDQQTIPFPSQDVLGSFPSFMSDKVENGVQTKDGMNESTTRRSVHLENRVPRVFDSMPEFEKTGDQPPWKVPNPKLRPVNIRGDIEEIKISQYPPENPKSENDIDHAFLLDDKGDLLRTNRGVATLEAESHAHETAFGRFKKIPVTVKSAIIISIAILMLAIFGFLSVLISCRLRQKKARLRVKQDILCEHLKNEDFMNSQQSLSTVLTKQPGRTPPVFTQNSIPSDTATNRQYYLWRTLRKTFQYD